MDAVKCVTESTGSLINVHLIQRERQNEKLEEEDKVNQVSRRLFSKVNKSESDDFQEKPGT